MATESDNATLVQRNTGSPEQDNLCISPWSQEKSKMNRLRTTTLPSVIIT